MKYFFCLLCYSLLLTLSAQEPAPPYQIVFYNVENLFHPSKDSLLPDAEFRPEAARRWTFYRYYAKVNRIAKALLSCRNKGFPDLIALAELEEESVLHDLARSAPLRKAGYKTLFFPSPDHRGMDLGCLYRAEKLFLVDQQALPLRNPQKDILPTRSMAALRFMVRGGDTLALLFCHWPSRYGGQKASAQKRLWAAQQVLRHWQYIEDQQQKPLFLMMGDLNDGPENESARVLAQGGLQPLSPSGTQKGSHKFRGHWLLLDQAWASPALLEQAQSVDFRVHAPAFLLEEDPSYGGFKPRRTYLGFRHQEGFSDHLPILFEAQWP